MIQTKKIDDPHLYRKLFTTCFAISGCTFGGGLVIMSMLQKKFVEELKWIDRDEMMDLIAIAQSCPGVMAVNSSIIIGYRVAGIPGALLTMVGTVLPPMIILSVISLFYRQFRDNRVISLLLKGMQAGVAAVLIHLTFTMCQTALQGRRPVFLLLLIGSAVAVIGFNVDVILTILVCAVVGGFVVLRDERSAEAQEKGGRA